MIVFDLICKEQHRFEGWFASGEDFVEQQSRGLLNCPVCGGVHVEKLPAAKIRTQAVEPAPAASGKPATEQRGSEKLDMSQVVDYLLTHSEDVGGEFSIEARRIFNQEAPQRSIRGVATRSEADSLREDGIPVFSLPIPPKDRWN